MTPGILGALRKLRPDRQLALLHRHGRRTASSAAGPAVMSETICAGSTPALQPA